MGCCIGKLRKAPKLQNVVSVDKAVITESPVLCSQSYVADSSSCIIRSPLPSSSSSTSSLKDRSFSNEFLVSCLKDNPQVVSQLNHIPFKVSDQSAFEFMSLGRRTPQRLEWQRSPVPAARRKNTISMDQDTPKYYSSTRKAAQLKSPSPNRRFNNSNYKHRRGISSRQGPQFNDRATASAHQDRRRRCSAYTPDSPSANRQVSSSALIGEMECMILEDLDNPLISLDCFIFL